MTCLDGTTSAYAEKSPFFCYQDDDWWNYLRIRGEERPINDQGGYIRELPPHTRRRVREFIMGTLEGGTTSAYAEKSQLPKPSAGPAWNYLRIRGEELS